MDQAILEQLQRLRARYHQLTDEMGDPTVAADFERMNQLAKERSDLTTLVGLLDGYEAAEAAAAGARALLNEDDAEMRELAESELSAAEERIETLASRIRRELLPRDPRDAR